MQLAGKASRVSEFKTFPPDSLACLEEQPAGAISGVSKDGRNCWGVRGCHLEVLDTSTGDRKAAWQFGKLTGDAHTRVTCVKEMCPHVGAIGGGALKLLVGVCDASPTGLLCLFDVASAKVVKAIEVPYPVTEVEVVSIHSQSVAPHEELPSHLHMISPRVRDIENQRFHCMSQGLHLAMDINETMFTRSGFEYQKPDGLVMKTFRPDMVAVTCLRYTPQAGLLIVGFNFGCFQLWKLHVPVLEYSSRLESEPLPISHITYQEPENDPKNFCYIWVARGQPEMDDGGYDPSVSSIALYQLAFNHKAFYSNYGVFYDGLASVGLRMEHNLTANLVQTGSNFEGSSKVISCSNMSDPFYQPPAVQQKDESFEEAGQGPDLSLCMFVWETTDGQSHVGRYLAVFDINRWYQAQMPASVRYVSGLQDVCAYFSWCKLDSAVEKASNDTLVAAHVSADRLRRFDSSLPMPPEQHFYPSALAFEYEHQGCTLKSVLDWTWDTVSKLKHQIDTLSAPLYNWSGLTLDERAVQTLVQCNQKLANLICVLKVFVSQTGPISVAGEAELNSKILVTSLINQHLSVVMWFFSVGLLPENDDTEVTLGGQYCYPATSLMSAYKSRREELAGIHVDVGETDLLLIDGLVEHIGVKSVWDREGGTGLYPPPSLHALLSCYLLESSDVLSKHCLVLYVLLDLVSVDSSAEDENFSEKVNGFAKRFHLPATLVKLIQAFWLLDHRDFEESLKLLLDPMVRTEFSRWQHRRIIKSLLYQGDARMALRYISTLKPALTTPEDVKLKLTVLLANGMIESALDYQRKCRDKTNMQDLLAHLFLGCQQTKTVDRLLQLPLTELEESSLVSHLMSSSEPHSQELLVMHYLQRARFVEAVQLNERLKHSIMTEGCPKARERASARNAIVEKYASVLPSVQRRLLFEQTHVPKKNTQWRREIRRPTPLSTKLTHRQSKVTSQSTYIMTIMETLDEIEDNKNDETKPLDRSAGPFVCTPVTPARRSLRNTTRYVSASCLTLLQTPTVRKVTPRKSRPSLSQAITPQSILKVRNMISTTSPSPHSGGTTPNSLETEGSARKFPRKLGYSGSTPLSSLPRHLMSQTGSAPASPNMEKSPRHASHVDRLQRLPLHEDLSPDAAVRHDGRSGVTEDSDLKLRLEESDENISDEDVEEMEGSFMSPATSPASADLSHVSMATVRELALTTSTSPDISQMEPSTSISPRKSPSSPTVKISKSHVSEFAAKNSTDSTENTQEHVQSATTSTEHVQTGSLNFGKLKTSEEPVSIDLTESNDEMEVEESENEGKVEQTGEIFKDYEEIHPPGGIEEEPMEDTISEVGDIVDENVAQEKVNAHIEQEVENEVAKVEVVVDEDIVFKTPVKQEPVEEEEDNSKTGSNVQQTSPGLVVFDKQLQRKSLTPPSERNIPLIKKKDSPPDSEYGVQSPEVHGQNVAHILEEIDNRFADTPVKEEEEDVKRNIKTEAQGKPRARRKFEIGTDVNEADVEEMSETVENIDDNVEQVVSSTVTVAEPESSVQEPTTPTRSSRRLHRNDKSPEKASGSLEEPVTPSRSTRGRKKKDEGEVTQEETVTPTRSTRRQSRELASPSREGAVSSTRSLHRQARIEKIKDNLVAIEAKSRKPFSQEAKEAVQESLLQISEELRDKDKEDEVDDDTMTKIKDKIVESPPRTPIRGRKKAETSTRSSTRHKKSDEDSGGNDENIPVTPTRTRRGTKQTSSPKSEVKTKATTPRRGRKKADTGSDDDKSNNNAIELGPVEGVSFTEPLTVKGANTAVNVEINDSFGHSVIPEDVEVDDATPGTPSRRSLSRSCKKHVDENDVPKTPTRRQSLRRGNKTDDIDVDLPRTPTRRSLGRAVKAQLVEEENVPKTPTRRQSVGRGQKVDNDETEAPKTPTRQQSVGRGQKAENDETEVPKTPTRRQSVGRGQKAENDEAEAPKTPTRRQSLGRSGKSQVEEENVPKTPTRRQSAGRPRKQGETAFDNEEKGKATTPSRGRGKKYVDMEVTETEKLDEGDIDNKQDTKKATPSRRGRPKKTDSSPEKDVAIAELEKPVTPSRRGRPKKTDASSEKVEKVTTPSRRGHKKDVKSDSEEEVKEDGTPVEKMTPSRRKKTKTEATPAARTRSHDQEIEETDMPSLQPDLYDIQPSGFQFSDPMHVASSEDIQPPKAFTPVKSFIFSPPVNHTRPMRGVELEQAPPILLPEQTHPPEEEAKDKGKKTTVKRKKKLYKEQDELLLISPASVTTASPSEEGRGVVTRETRARKAQTKKDGTKIVVQGIEKALRGRKSSYRMGPVTKKK
ncbi:ELYS-like protein [Mya arenaria]|uniref:ELYS-like protein n=1 Tax=Mya arenaria TaxID=6604 RepID=A0ABY7F0F1_MYAAR|nr:ELYS-like protein [Mya arenaria]